MRLGSSSSHPSLAEKEKQRRDRMKDLYSTLATLLRLQPYERIPLLKFLDQATTSLQHLSERVERLKGKKEELEKNVNGETSNVHKLQLVQVREIDLKLEAILIIPVNNKKAEPSEVLRVIEDGGAQIMSSSFSTVGQYIYCTIHAKAFQARVGFDAELIESKLLKLVFNR